MSRMSKSHATSAYRSVSHTSVFRAARPYRVERVEHVIAVHHEPTPAMEPGRATEIQMALIHAGYLSGEPTGVWDADSIAAMQKLQDANGWQTKYTPDSRALLKLGLGGAPTSSSQIAQAADPTPANPIAQP